MAVQLSCVWIIASSVQVCYHPRQCGEDGWRQQFAAWCPVVADGVIWHFLHLKHSFWQCKDIETLLLCLTGLWWENTGDNQWGFQFVVSVGRVKLIYLQDFYYMMPYLFKCRFQDPSAVGIEAWVGRQTWFSQSISTSFNCQRYINHYHQVSELSDNSISINLAVE